MPARPWPVLAHLPVVGAYPGLDVHLQPLDEQAQAVDVAMQAVDAGIQAVEVAIQTVEAPSYGIAVRTQGMDALLQEPNLRADELDLPLRAFKFWTIDPTGS